MILDFSKSISYSEERDPTTSIVEVVERLG